MNEFRLGTFATAAGAKPFAGVVLQDGQKQKVLALTALEDMCKSLGHELRGTDSVLNLLEHWPKNFDAIEAAVHEILEKNLPLAFTDSSQLQVLPPVNLPRQIFCSGANYKKHVVDIIVAQGGPHLEGLSTEERRAWGNKRMDDRAANGKPFVFTKLPSSIIGPFDDLILPTDVLQPDWELELAVVIGKAARRVRRQDALSFVAGYAVANDVTARDKVNRPDIPEMGMDWLASKSTPGFLPFGPFITPTQFVPNPQDLTISLKLNGENMQHESTADMIFPVAQLIEFISGHVQLLPGDIICTGSPAGNGMHYKRFLRENDVMEGSITGLGAAQRNTCKLERSE